MYRSVAKIDIIIIKNGIVIHYIVSVCTKQINALVHEIDSRIKA